MLIYYVVENDKIFEKAPSILPSSDKTILHWKNQTPKLIKIFEVSFLRRSNCEDGEKSKILRG